MKNKINGWLVIDKPLGPTSTRVGSNLKRYLRPTKIGHIGTLDPLASGVLTFALGEATKLIPYWNITAKHYTFHITFGQRRSTDDCEGDVIECSDIIPTPNAINQCLNQFIGTISQIPPNYSAIQIDGKRSYDRARSGEDFILPSRHVHIDRLELIQQISEGAFEFNVVCGTGTYVRSLARDIATACGTVGYVSFLRRTKDGCFSIQQSIGLETLLEQPFDQLLDHFLLEYQAKNWHNNLGFFPLSSVLDDIPAVTVGENDSKRLYLGQTLSLPDQSLIPDGIVQIHGSRGIFAIGNMEAGHLKPKRLLHLGEHDVDYT